MISQASICFAFVAAILVLNLDHIAAKIQRKWPCYKSWFFKFLKFCFHRWSTFFMFFPWITIKTIFVAIFSQAISAKMVKTVHNYHYRMAQYGQKYIPCRCLWKEQEKCRSPVKTELKICLGLKVMAKSNWTLKIWPFPSYFDLILVRIWI